jgi:3-oxoacyl-[acyl-carrier protein] reductase
VELEGKVAIVTGASRNIGRAIALELARAGAGVAVIGRSAREAAEAVAAEIGAAGGRAFAALADVRDEAAIGKIVEDAHRRFGRIDILVNNAAVRPEGKLDTIDPARFRDVVSIVLDGAFICTKACLPHLRQSGSGAIVNIGGLTGHTGAKDRPHVVAAKAGLVGLTRALARDLAEEGVTVNCVSPGMIDTVREKLPGMFATHKPPVGRLGRPEEIAAAVRYLVGPGARYVTGQTIHVNGGMYMG